jgi:hypothetical protein
MASDCDVLSGVVSAARDKPPKQQQYEVRRREWPGLARRQGSNGETRERFFGGVALCLNGYLGLALRGSSASGRSVFVGSA